MRILIKGGRVLDPYTGRDGQADVLIDKGCIAAVAPELSAEGACEVLDACGLVVCPGLIDMHVHLREPGEEYKETIATGTAAAAAGGFTAVACMANTQPVNDCAAVTRAIREKAATEGVVKVLPVGALTRGLEGRELTEAGDLRAAGCVALSDDGHTVADAQMMRLGLEYAAGFNLPVISHCHDPALSRGGCMHEGAVSTRLGLRGIPATAEEVIVARDIALATWSRYAVHIAHVSTAGSVRIVRDAKRRGAAVTAETAPHYFTLTDTAVCDCGTNAKMYPPLRTAADVAAIKQGLADGTIDVIASDHAPHSELEKDVEFDRAAFGIVGLETALPLSLALVRDGVLSLPQLLASLTVHPARVLQLDIAGLVPGAPADVTVIDPQCRWTLDRAQLRSRSRNTPFHGWELIGRAAWTIVDGRVVYTRP